jgi:hypothetical protein
MGAMMIMNLSKGVSEHAVKQNLMFFIIFLLIYQCVGFIFVYIYNNNSNNNDNDNNSNNNNKDTWGSWVRVRCQGNTPGTCPFRCGYRKAASIPCTAV